MEHSNNNKMDCNVNESALDVLSRAASFVETTKLRLETNENVRIKTKGVELSSSKSSRRRSPPPPPSVDVRETSSSPSKELVTRTHKIRRNKERRRDLSRLSFRKDRTNKCIVTEKNKPFSESVNDEDDKMDGDDDRDDDDDEKIEIEDEVKLKMNYEQEDNNKPMEGEDRDEEEEDDDDDEDDVLKKDDDVSEEDDDIEVKDRYEGYRSDSNGTMVEDEEEEAEEVEEEIDNDSPLDMTTVKRQERDGGSLTKTTTRSSPPPYIPAQLLSNPSPFCSNPRLLYGPFSQSSQPPPPYHHHPLVHNPHLQQHHHHRHLLNLRRPSPPSPPTSSSNSSSSSSFLLPMSGAAHASVNGSSSPSKLTHLQQRPSVITCAPRSSAGSPKSSTQQLGRRTLSDPTPTPLVTSSYSNKQRRGSSDVRHGHRREILSGMCDPVIDEHFRRSLGKDYPEFLASSSSSSSSPLSTAVTTGSSTATASSVSSIQSTTGSSVSSVSITGMSVDDHFAKALGDTWLRLQGKITSSSCSPCSTVVSSPSTPSGSPSPGASSAASSPPSPPLRQRHGVVSS